MIASMWLALVLAAPAPVAVAPTRQDCPDGAAWIGHAPPDGRRYACMLERDGAFVKHGWAVEYHPDTDHRISECEYRHGLLHGRCSKYDADGRLLRRGQFHAGEAVGYHWRWDALPATTVERRVVLLELLEQWQVPPTEIDRMVAHVLAHYDRELDDIRNSEQLCGDDHCVSAGRVGGRAVIAIRLPPAAE